MSNTVYWWPIIFWAVFCVGDAIAYGPGGGFVVLFKFGKGDA